MTNHQPDHRQDILVAVGLFAITVLSRIPFCSQILYHWDSVNFAYAMREFSVAKEQPQPPGYIVYVWLCRLVDSLFGNPQTTMVWISIVAGALAVVALFYLGRSMFDHPTGLLAALFLATSPLFWFYGEIALPHSLDMLLVIVGGWWLYETMCGRHRYLYPAVVMMAVAGGARQQTLVFLAPLILYALRRASWKRLLVAGTLGIVICLAWFVPLIALNGGYRAYMEAVQRFSDRFDATTSVLMGAGWWGMQRNLTKLGMYTLFGWSVALLPFIAYVVVKLWRREWPRNWEKIIFFTLWLAPTLIFYTLIHMGQQGLVFVFLPALLLWGATGLVRLLGPGRQRLTVAAAPLLAINVALFCLAPEYPLGGDRIRLLTRETLTNSDHYYQDRFTTIRASFSPKSTVIVAANWHHVEYYLPEYTSLPYTFGSKWEKDEGIPKNNLKETAVFSPAQANLQPDRDGQVAVIIFDPDLMAFNSGSAPVHELQLEHGKELKYFTLKGNQAFYYGPLLFGVKEN